MIPIKKLKTSVNTMASSFFAPYILQPTRLSSKTLIDNIFFISLEYCSHCGNLLIEISDHLLQFLILDGFVKEKAIPEINLYKRDIRNFNKDEFSRDVSDMDWENMVKLKDQDVNSATQNLYQGVTYLLDELAPCHKISKQVYKLRFKPWINREILDQIKERDKLLKHFIKEKNDDLKLDTRNRYKLLRNRITSMKRVSIFKYFDDYFDKNKRKIGEI